MHGPVSIRFEETRRVASAFTRVSIMHRAGPSLCMASIFRYFKNMTNPQDYSVEKCTFAQMIEALSVRCGCVAHYHTLKPNDTTICTPAHLYACYYGAYQSSVQVSTSDGKSKDIVSFCSTVLTKFITSSHFSSSISKRQPQNACHYATRGTMTPTLHSLRSVPKVRTHQKSCTTRSS